MSTPTQSYLKVSYDLRPAKQIERRMLIDAFHRLSSAGFPISDYRYTGMGSVYFVDFIMFHKLLGIKKLLSVEWDETIEKRVRFNRPFKEIEVEVGRPIGEVIPTLSSSEQHILWLDYDDILRREHLVDVALAASTLPPGSILLVTVDIEPPPGAGPAEWRAHFEEQAEEYLGKKPNANDYSLSEIPALNAHIVGQAINQGMAGRRGVTFVPLFNFIYRDGNQMLTVGGMVATAADKRKIQRSGIERVTYYRGSFDSASYRIRVPKLTRKERLYLDKAMPCADGWLPEEFELSPDDVNAYREVYRFFPAYAEMLL